MGDAAQGVAGAPALPWGEAFVATVVVLALLAATLWLLRRGVNRPGRPGATMSVESSLGLGERRSLVVVNVEGRRLVLGLAPGQVRLVTDLGSAPAGQEPR
jgi:flagellar protein FliO/FliZ